jgi:Domain of unknown function (DUF4386)
MYSSGLVPRRIAWFGLIGGPLLLISSIGTLFQWWDAGTTIPAILVIPEFILEAFLGIYCAGLGVQAGLTDPFAYGGADLSQSQQRRK